MSNNNLQFIKVLDLTRLLPGAICTLILEDLGAEVLKVEDTKGGDYMRYLPPLIKNNQMSAYFEALCRGKKSMKLNLKTNEGKEIFFELVKRYDVVVESFRPHVMDKLGVGYNTLNEINDKIIFCSISGYGQSGPYRDRAGHDINYIALSGILGLTGKKDNEPIIPGVQIADITGGILSALSILFAIIIREKNGKGQYIDVSLFESCFVYMHMLLAYYFAQNKVINRGEHELTGAIPNYNIYETKDKEYFSIGCLEQKFIDKFIELTGLVNIFDKKKIEEVFKNRTKQELIDYFKYENDLPVEPILNLKEVIEHEQVKARGLIEDNKIKFPVKFSSSYTEFKKDAPLYGQHTEEVLKELGYDTERIEELKKKEVI